MHYYQTFAAQTLQADLDADASLAGHFDLQACTVSIGTMGADLTFVSNAVFRSTARRIVDYSVVKMCRDLDRCTTWHDCQVNDGRLDEELSLIRKTGMDRTDRNSLELTGVEWGRETCTGCNPLNPTAFPKVLSSHSRLEAVLKIESTPYERIMRRSAPGATSLVLRRVGAGVSYVVLSASEAIDDSIYNFGKSYVFPEGYESRAGYISDAVRIQTFDSAANPVEATVTFGFEWHLAILPLSLMVLLPLL